MNVKRFTARTSRDALTLVRQAFGDDAVVLSTKPCADGVEVLAMAPESVAQIERVAAPAAAPRPAASPSAPASRALASRPAARPPERPEPVQAAPVEDDVEQLSMSTLSFQDYVRERMLKKRDAAMKAEASAAAAAAPVRMAEPGPLTSRMAQGTVDESPFITGRPAQPAALPAAPAARAPMARRDPPLLNEVMPAVVPHAELHSDIHVPSLADNTAARRDQQDMMNELKSMKGLIEERFGALAFMEKLQRQPAQARMTQKLLDCGFSPALIRKLAESLSPEVTDEAAWAAGVLERNLLTGDTQPPLEDQGGVFALIGSTGVGKTTTTAKIAAAFATQHGAGNLGLITLDAYRVAAHEQLRAYGRILGVPVHTAHDRASLEDLLELLSGKKMVLIDTAGMAQRDSRTRELMGMLSHRSINKLLVVNASAQGETIEDVLISYRAAAAKGVVLSKIDEAVKLGPALDAMIRHKLTVLGVANGQRVPEDWHRLSAHALVQRALRATAGTAYRMDSSDVNLIFASPQQGASLARGGLHA
jgi:flagellar biosynthesis protein FlhF